MLGAPVPGQVRSSERRLGPKARLNEALRWSPLAIFGLVFALAMYGFLWVCKPAPSWYDAVYDTLQLFVLAGIDQECLSQVDGAARVTHWTLWWAQMLAAALVFLAVLRVFFMPVWTWLQLNLQAMRSVLLGEERFILIGFGALNQEIARDLAHRRKPMTIVSREFDGAARDFAASARAVLLERDIRREGALGGLKIEKSHRIVIACGEDSLTYEVARRIGARYAEKVDEKKALEVVHAHFTSTEMHRQVLRSRDLGLGTERRFSGFSIREETAHYLMARAWLVERAHLAKQSRVHLVIMGGGDLGLAVTREALQNGYSAKLKEPPLITVIDKDGAEVKKRFRAAMPRIFDETIPEGDRPVVQFMQCRAEAVGLADAAPGVETPVPGIGAEFVKDDPEDETEKAVVADVTGWVICCPEDGQNLTLAMKLESAMRRGLMAPAPIYPRQWQANISEAERRGLGQADPLHLVAPFGGMDDVVETLSFMDPTLERIARCINAEYHASQEVMKRGTAFWDAIAEYGMPPWAEGKAPENQELAAKIVRLAKAERKRFLEDWADASDETKLKNLAPARQAALRLWEFGFDWKGRHAGILPKLQPIYIEANIPDEPKAALDQPGTISAIAAAEHRRWMVEQALRGWSAVEKSSDRSNELRLHNNFKTFKGLGTVELVEAEGDVRVFDVSTLRGIMQGLVQNESASLARRPPDPLVVDIDKIDEPLTNVCNLVLNLPEGMRESAELQESLGHIKAWMADTAALALCLRPATPETLDPKAPALREAINAIYQHELKLQDRAAVRRQQRLGVYISMDFPDARALRLERMRVT